MFRLFPFCFFLLLSFYSQSSTFVFFSFWLLVSVPLLLLWLLLWTSLLLLSKPYFRYSHVSNWIITAYPRTEKHISEPHKSEQLPSTSNKRRKKKTFLQYEKSKCIVHDAIKSAYKKNTKKHEKKLSKSRFRRKCLSTLLNDLPSPHWYADNLKQPYIVLPTEIESPYLVSTQSAQQKIPP